MKRRVLTIDRGRRLVSQTAAALPREEPDEYANADPPAGEPMARKVYLAPYRATGGLPLLVVVNARGERILEVPVAPGVDEHMLTIGLRAWLDVVDPLPKKADEKPITIIRALRLVQ